MIANSSDDKQQTSAILNAENDQKSTALHYAASKGRGESPFCAAERVESFIALRAGHCEIIQLLVDRGAKKNLANKYGVCVCVGWEGGGRVGDAAKSCRMTALSASARPNCADARRQRQPTESRAIGEASGRHKDAILT